MSGATFFAEQVRAWSSPPVDDIGYIPSADLLAMPDGEFLALVDRMRFIRYSEQAWRNLRGDWRRLLKLDNTRGFDVLDFGCGVGMEAVELARHNRVTLADISGLNLAVAERLFKLRDLTPAAVCLVAATDPFASIPWASLDVVHCSGVLHHIPWARQILAWFRDILRPGGEVRLMLYSDRGWRNHMGTEPPAEVTIDPLFRDFVRTFDQVGAYADWYDLAKLGGLADGLFQVEAFDYICDDDRYCIATLGRV